MGDEGKDDPLALSGSEYRDKEQESIAVTHVLDTKSLVNDTTLASKRKSDESINDDPKLALVEDDHKTSILDDTSNSSPKVKNAKIGGDISKTATHADTPNTAGNDVTGDDDAIPVNVTGPTATSGKKISAKELVQHVKNQKKKIQDQEAEIGKLSAQFGICRMRALAMAIDLVSAASTRKSPFVLFTNGSRLPSVRVQRLRSSEWQDWLIERPQSLRQSKLSLIVLVKKNLIWKPFKKNSAHYLHVPNSNWQTKQKRTSRHQRILV